MNSIQSGQISGATLVAAAAHLANARQTGVRLNALPCEAAPLSLEQGFQIQQHVGVLAGAKIGGWKCALPKPDKWIVAPLYADSIHSDAQYVLGFDTAEVRIEPELACVLGTDLPARDAPYTERDIAQAISRVHVALEVIDCRYNDPQKVTFEQLLADGLFNHGLVLGPAARSLEPHALPARLDITLRHPGIEPLCIEGAHPDQHPLAPIVWLANFLAARGIDLLAGQVVITGSYAGVLQVPTHQPLDIQFGAAGSLSVSFITHQE